MAKPSTRSTQINRPTTANETSDLVLKGRSAIMTNQKHNPSRKPSSKARSHHQSAGDTSSAQYRTRTRVATEHAEIRHEHALTINQKRTPTKDSSPLPVIRVDSKIQSNILMVLLDSLWNTILSTNLDARTRKEGLGYELTALELRNWESVSAMRPMGSSTLFITATTSGQEDYDRKVLLKSNLASLFVTLLTTPSKLTSKPIEAFICESILSEHFVNDTRSGQAFVEFISEYEVQKYCLARLETLEEETPSLFDTDQAPRLTLWDYVRYLRPKECLQPAFEHPLSPAFQMCCRVSYEELIPIRSSTQELESQNPYSGLIDSIIHLFRSEFPEFKLSKHTPTHSQSHSYRPSSIARSSMAFAAQHTPRPTNLLRAKSHVPEEQTDERRENRPAVPGLRGGDDEDEDLSDSNSRSASQSFLIDALIPPQNSNSQMDDLAESYDGPYAGSPEARHHENVANEIELNANLCRGLSRELNKSPNKFSARFSHPVPGTAQLDDELDKIEGSKERQSLPNKQPQRRRFEFSRPQPDASQLSWSETQIPTPGNNRESAPVADRSYSNDVGPVRGNVESESRGVSSASSDLQQQKRQLPSSDIHMELGLHQDHPTESEESPSRLGEQPSSGLGEAESGAQRQQHSGSNNHTAVGRNFIESEESSQQLGERSRSGSGQGESEEGSSVTSRAEQHQRSNMRHDPTECEKRAGEQSGSKSAEGQVRGRSSASSDVQMQQHSSSDNRWEGVPELVNSTKSGESPQVTGSGLSAQQLPDTPCAQHIGFNGQADPDEPGAGAQERSRLGETVGAGEPSPDQFVDDHRQQEAGESERKSSGRREGLKERENDECMEEGEEEGTQTIRAKKQRAREEPGSASRQLESPVDLHSRTFKGENKQLEPTASTFKQKKQAGERPGRSKQTHRPPLRGRQAQTFETDLDDTSDDDEQVKDKAEMSTEAKTNRDETLDGKLEEVNSKAPAQGSQSVAARSKRPRKAAGIARAGSIADTSDDEQQGQGQGRKGSERKKRRRKANQGSRESSPTDRASPSKGASSKVPTEKKTQRRQFWTDEQEELLINEVVRFHDKYNCMAYILRRHGPGGYKSQVLANRTNVMLKDKAVQISTKWARQGANLDEKTRSAFSRFPPKSGVICGSSAEMGTKVEEVEEAYEIEEVEVEGDWTGVSKRARTEVGGGPQASGSDAALPSEPVGPARAGEALKGPPSPDKTPKSRTSLSPRVVSERRSPVHPRANTPLGEGKNGSQEIPIARKPERGGQISQGDFPVLSSPR
ncbi:hypothetical protein CROQUDRAFT_726594 [Cronartium quercuum f. sp. fusiforme G11]|uniref:Myb-like domain-containing protein n=1 Tax=Cronartium quercuum f. sp. fusiforme G11 TaxID=708437 RepID=A0A9P6N606_9BASI|nr:hypothetical protein CROQUDRAFT_726594 [Cronartium quercuum f. sp. fusiforme G11]